MPRPSFDEFYLDIAKSVATRGECVRRKVGSVLVKDNAIVAASYNGAPSGEDSCLDGACPRAREEGVVSGVGYEKSGCRVIHSEVNLLLRASWHQMQGATLYCTDDPCEMCAPLIRAAGIARVVTPSGETLLR